MAPPIQNEFSGHIHAVLASQPGEKPHEEDINNNLDGEQETLPPLTTDDLQEAIEGVDPPPGPYAATWRASVASASKGVTEKTDSEYQCLAKQCVAFLLDNQAISKAEDFLCPNPPNDADIFIISWIMHECDEIMLDGHHKLPEMTRSRYTHAQKMCASMTHVFGWDLGLGNQRWRKQEGSGRMVGNPLVSLQLASYMVSLRNHKVHAGDVATSARAITPEILYKLYHYNHHPENWDQPASVDPQTSKATPNKSTGYSTKAKNLHQWGGPLMWHGLQAIHTLAFLCLLHSDEVLKIQVDHIKFVREVDGDIERADVQPIYIYPLEEDEAHLCAVHAMAQWIKASQITSGFLFRKFTAQDCPSAHKDQAMTSEKFLELFHKNLLDIGIDPLPYGMHSFRRGGCQYLASCWHWSLHTVCEWGGWSTEFLNLTIIHYLISANDDPMQKREDFFNPKKMPTL